MSAQIKCYTKVQIPKPIPNKKVKKFVNIFPLESKEKILRAAEFEKKSIKTGNEDPVKLENVVAALKRTKKGSLKQPSFEENPKDICIFKDCGDLSQLEISPEFSFKDPDPPKEENPFVVEEEEEEEEIDMEIPKYKTYLHEELLKLKLQIEKELSITRRINSKLRCEAYCKKLTEIRLKSKEELRIKNEGEVRRQLENIKLRKEKEEEATRISDQIEAEYCKLSDDKLEAVFKKIADMKLEEDEIIERHTVVLHPVHVAYGSFKADHEKLSNLYCQRGSTLNSEVSENINSLFISLMKKSEEDIITDKDINDIQREISLGLQFLMMSAANIPESSDSMQIIKPVAISAEISQTYDRTTPNIQPIDTTRVNHTVSVVPPEGAVLSHPIMQSENTFASIVPLQSVTIPIIKSEDVVAPLLKPDAVTAPIIQTGVVVDPIIQIGAVAAPIIQTSAVAAPIIQISTLATPIIQTSAVVAPIIQTGAEAATNIKSEDLSASLLQPGALAAPIVQPEAVALPILHSVGDFLPIIQPVADSQPILQPVGEFLPIIQPVGESSPIPIYPVPLSTPSISVSNNGPVTPIGVLASDFNRPEVEPSTTTAIVNPKGDIVIPELRSEAEARYFQIKEKIAQVQQLANAPKNNSPVWINLARAAGVINQLKNTVNDSSNRSQLQQLYNLLAGRTCYVGNTTVSTEGHAPACAFVVNHLSVNIINLAHDLQVSCMAVYASLIIRIWMAHTEVGELIYGRLCEVCPFLVPLKLVKDAGMTDEQFKLMMGFRANETICKYLTRMGAAARLYGRIVSMEIEPHPHGISEGWKFLTRLLNQPPLPNVSASILYGFLSSAGSALLRTYGKQFAKLLYFIGIVYLPKMETATVDGGQSDFESLKKFLLEFHHTHNLPAPDEGYTLLL